MAGELERFGVRSVALHRGLYVRNPAVPSSGWFAARGLLAHGWKVQRTAGPVWLFERGGIGIAPTRIEPSHSRPIFCQGWFGGTGSGRYMSETHAPFWIYGSGKLRLEFAPSELRPGPKYQLLSVNESEQQDHPCRKLVSKVNGHWQLAQAGLHLLDLLTY